MEQHPVPKNVLTVEFKLFGALTVKQFLKILAGCLIALVIYLLGIHPLIGLPLMIISVLTGLGAALVKGFETKFSGLVKALFVSPRYVWRKGSKVPDALSADVAKAAPKQTTETVQDKDDADLAIVNLLEARAARASKTQGADNVQETNFDRVYSQEFEQQQSAPGPRPTQPEQRVVGPIAGLAGTATEGQLLSTGPNQQIIVQPVQNRAPHLLDAVAAAAPVDSKQGRQPVRPEPPTVFGVVVNQANAPLAGVLVKFRTSGGQEFSSTTGEDGRFKLEGEMTPGEYIVDLILAGHKFPEYKLPVAQGHLPAFKFRSLD